MSKRKDEDGVDGDVFSRRTASEWVLLFDAKPGKLDVQGTSKISYVCPALAGCQLGRAKDRHSFRCGSDDNDIDINQHNNNDAYVNVGMHSDSNDISIDQTSFGSDASVSLAYSSNNSISVWQNANDSATVTGYASNHNTVNIVQN